MVASVIKDEGFKGGKGETALIRFKKSGKVSASRLLLVGAGDKKDYGVKDVCVVSGTAARRLREKNLTSFALDARCVGDATDIATSAAQGAVTSQFDIDKYKTKGKNDKAIKTFVLFIDGAKPADLKNGLSSRHRAR